MEQAMLVALGVILTLCTSAVATWFQQRGERYRLEAQQKHDKEKMDREQGQRIGEAIRRIYSRCSFHLVALRSLCAAAKEGHHSSDIDRHQLAAFAWVSRLLLVTQSCRDVMEKHAENFYAFPRELSPIDELRAAIVTAYQFDERVKF